MNNKDLDIAFKKAVDHVNDHKSPFPADTLLKLYAYYKKATNNYSRPNSKKAIINAFKTNALFQAKNITEDQAKQEYINLVESYFKHQK